MDEPKLTDKEKFYELIYDALDNYKLSMTELMEVFFAVLLEQETLLDEKDESADNNWFNFNSRWLQTKDISYHSARQESWPSWTG